MSEKKCDPRRQIRVAKPLLVSATLTVATLASACNDVVSNPKSPWYDSGLHDAAPDGSADDAAADDAGADAE